MTNSTSHKITSSHRMVPYLRNGGQLLDLKALRLVIDDYPKKDNTNGWDSCSVLIKGFYY